MLQCSKLLSHWEEVQVCSQCGSMSEIARHRVCPVCHGYRFTTGLPVVWAAVQEAKEHAFPKHAGTAPRLPVDKLTD